MGGRTGKEIKEICIKNQLINLLSGLFQSNLCKMGKNLFPLLLTFFFIIYFDIENIWIVNGKRRKVLFVLGNWISLIFVCSEEDVCRMYLG